MISVLGAGAFGTALAVTLSRSGKPVCLWGRDITRIGQENPMLPGVVLPRDLTVTDDITRLAKADIHLLALPMQAQATFLAEHAALLSGRAIVNCAKGFDLTTGAGATEVIARAIPSATPALLSGPSFAADIGRGLPTALTLAAKTEAQRLQHALATPTLRLYRSDDTQGVEIGGALKNVIAIACGAVIGMGMGDSARAALMTRGFAEMQRLGAALGARAETLAGLSGLGDLALTCGSDLSRNYRAGVALGQGTAPDHSLTVEGIATAQAAVARAAKLGIDLPISRKVAEITRGEISVHDAIQALLSRPLKAE